MHPVADPQMSARFKKYGRLGSKLVRGTINSAAVLAMVESGMFRELPDLRVVVTALAIGGAHLAGGFDNRQIYIDTTGFYPATVRSAVDLFGADRVLMGTDWPVVLETPERAHELLAASGLDTIGRQKIGRENTLELLGVA
jgi:predicted TIM-barrel fold metal-dependent hydrolase